MNNVRQLRQKKGIQQKELAIEIGVTNATVSDWEHGRKNPSGERLRRLSEFFGVEPMVVLGQLPDQRDLFVPEDPAVSGKSETEQIVQYVLEKLNIQPGSTSESIKTPEARLLAKGVDRMPQEQREQALNIVRAVFAKYATYFENGDDANDA